MRVGGARDARQVSGDRACDVAQAQVVTSAVAADEGEYFIDADTPRLHDRAFGLLDDDAAVERALQLFGEQLSPADRPLRERPIAATSASACTISTSVSAGAHRR